MHIVGEYVESIEQCMPATVASRAQRLQLLLFLGEFKQIILIYILIIHVFHLYRSITIIIYFILSYLRLNSKHTTKVNIFRIVL